MAATPQTWHQRLLAACLAGPAVASHRSSAALWRLPGFALARVEVTAVRHRRRKAHDVIGHESRRLDARDVTEIERVPVTAVTRTLLDLGAVVDVPTLLVCFDDGVRRSLTSWLRLSSNSKRLAIEIDGARNHAGTADWQADLARQNRRVALGWRILRFTAYDLQRRPQEVADEIRKALTNGRQRFAFRVRSAVLFSMSTTIGANASIFGLSSLPVLNREYWPSSTIASLKPARIS